MPIITDLEIVIDKTKVLEAIQCYKNNPGYEETMALYEELLPEFKLLVNPAGAYAFIDNTMGFSVPEISQCSKVVYCVLTLGQDICNKIRDCFAEGSYLKGNLFNAMCDELLAYYEQAFYLTIKKEADDDGCGLTRKLTPGEHGFASGYEQEIIEWFGSISPFGAFSVLPSKSLVYLYGADSEQLTEEIVHDCQHCDNINCHMREKGEKDSKIKLTVLSQDGTSKIFEADRFKSLLINLQENGIYAAAPCSGRGTCGKCKIKIIQGMVQHEALNYERLQPQEICEGICLACQTYPNEDCTIELLGVQEEHFSIEDAFLSSNNVVLDTGVAVKRLVLADAAWKSGTSLAEYINASLQKDYFYSHRALIKLSRLTEGPLEQVVNLIIEEQTVVDVCPEGAVQVLGLAIDIGTTTIVISLVDLLTGAILKNSAVLNSQRQYGADVISRIEYSMAGGADRLKECVCQDILKGIRTLTEDLTAIYHVVIAGNTTMLYLLLGFSVHSLAGYPFRITTGDLLELSFQEVFNSNIADCKVTILPGISAYIGADIMAGLLQCGFAAADKKCMLIDIGTNGEMAIGDKHKVMCLAAAAGPAFEGANMTAGTGSIRGAISSFTIKEDNMYYQTIQNAPPIGICGSGAIDIAAECLRNGWLNKSGEIHAAKAPEGFIKIAEGIYGDLVFTQKDIRELQLAKAAIRTGIDILIENSGLCYADIDTVYLAGGFGTNINVENAVAIGLIPRELKYKVKLVGNSALGGVIHYLLNKEYKKEMHYVKKAATCLDLSIDDKFNSLFVKNMSF